MNRTLCILLLVLGGCFGQYDPDDTDPDGSSPTQPATEPFIVGPEGGTQSFGDATIVIPEGALDEELEIRLIETPDDPPEPYLGLSKVWRAEPEGLVFAEPVTIRLPIDADAVEGVEDGSILPTFWWSNDDGGYDRIRPALTNDGSTELRADVEHFSTGFIAQLPTASVTEPEPFPPADVLFIVDNSCSMFDEQQALAVEVGAVIPTLDATGIDYHLGVVTTDMADPQNGSGRLQLAQGVNHIDAATPDAATVFQQMAVAGTAGNFEEMGRAPAWTMVEEKWDIPRNAGFYREEATLTFVFLSDEEDQSGANPITRQEFRTWMETKKVRPEDVVAHIIVDLPGQPCPSGDTDGTEYVRYANWTGGEQIHICDPDWSPGFQAMADRLLDSARVVLSEPAAEIEEVALTEAGAETVLSEDDWSYDPALTTVFLAPGVATADLESIRVDYVPE